MVTKTPSKPMIARTHHWKMNPAPAMKKNRLMIIGRPELFGIWIGRNGTPLGPLMDSPVFFINHQASRPLMVGMMAKLYSGAGDVVAHSSERPSHGSPVVSR